MNQNVITMMMKKFVSGPPNKLYTLNRIEAAQCWDRIINDDGLVNEHCCVNVPPHKDFRKFNIPSLKTPRSLRKDPKVFKQMSVFRLPSPPKRKGKEVEDCCRKKIEKKQSEKQMKSLQSSVAIASAAAATSRFQDESTSIGRQGPSTSRIIQGEIIPSSKQGTNTSEIKKGSVIPSNRQESILTSRQGSVYPSSSQVAGILTSRQGSVIPSSRHGASIRGSKKGQGVSFSSTRRKPGEESSFKKNPTYWLDPKLVPPVPPGFRESEFEMEPQDDPTGEIRRDLMKAKETARRYTRFAHIIEKAIHVIPNLEKVDKTMDEHYVTRDPNIRRQTLLHNFFSSPKMDTSPEFKRDAIYATILSRNDNPKENIVKKPFPYSLAEMSKSKLKIRQGT